MSFAPVVPMGGVAGWRYLTRTLDAQKAAHADRPDQQRLAQDYRARIDTVSSASDLVSDRGLLQVALGAYGLQDDLPNRYFVEKILSEGTRNSGSLANRMTDARYAALSSAFAFDAPTGSNATSPDFAERVIDRYLDQSFEVAVGEQDQDFRLALGLERGLSDLVGSTRGADARWFAVMGAPPLRAVFETALGLPTSFATLPIDRQLSEFRTRSEAVFGSGEVADFLVPETLEDLQETFLLRSQSQQRTSAVSGSGSTALALLGGGGSSASLLSIYYSG